MLCGIMFPWAELRSKPEQNNFELQIPIQMYTPWCFSALFQQVFSMDQIVVLFSRPVCSWAQQQMANILRSGPILQLHAKDGRCQIAFTCIKEPTL